MEWPTSVTTKALFADFPETVFNLSGHPAWELLNPDHPSGIKQTLSKQLQQLGSKHPVDAEYVTINEQKGPVHVEDGAIIEPHVHLIGPCLIQSTATVRAHAYVRENTWMMHGSLLGHSSESKHALFLPRAKAPHFNYVGDSVLGSDVNLGAGVKLSNLRNDGATVAIWIDNERRSTGIRKFGAIIGDGTQLGCNTVTNPGTVLGQHCMAHPNTTVSGLHAPSSVLR